METTDLIKLLNEDLETEFQSIVQFVQHVATISGPEDTSTVDELKLHLTQELAHATALAEQISFLGGAPSAHVPDVAPVDDSRAALQADLALETDQLERVFTDRTRPKCRTHRGTSATPARTRAECGWTKAR